MGEALGDLLSPDRTARLAQAAWFRARSGVRPVLLADDVLGELDDVRRSAFWKEIGEGHQVIATGTRPPPGNGWLTYEVASGAYRKG